MDLTITRLLGYDGPNLHGPQPGVLLQIYGARGHAEQLRRAIRHGGQRAGLVVGYLEVQTAPVAGGVLTSATFATPTPALGVDLARIVVDGLRARLAGDADWDDEEPLWELGRRRRAAALPLEALRLVAEARGRGVPAFVRPDGRLQVGYGARGLAVEVGGPAPEDGARIASAQIGVRGRAPIGPADAEGLPWERLGAIPILALSGAGHPHAARRLAGLLEAAGQRVALAASADFDAARALLADPAARLAVIGLTQDSLVRRGVPFERCAGCGLLGLPDALPPEVDGRSELARAIGLPALLTDPRGTVALLIDQPELAALAEYAAAPLTLLSARPDHPLLAEHRQRGGAAVFPRAGAVVAAQGAAELPLAPADAPAEQLPALLAALALARAHTS